MSAMPYGALLVEEFEPSRRAFRHTFQTGSDPRLSSAASFPTSGFRQLIQESEWINAIVQSIPGLQNTRIYSSIRVRAHS
jgi:hypothetical protein